MMLSYSANKQGNKLVDITKITAQMTATTTAGEFNLNSPGEWFYFTDGADKALYETVRQSANGTIVKRNDDTVVINAFSQAITLGQTEAVIILSDVQNEAQEAVKEIVHETIINQPIVQPVIVQPNEQIPVLWESQRKPIRFDDEDNQPSPAESWGWNTIAIQITERGGSVFNDHIPESVTRPNTYAVFSYDDEIRDIGFSDDRNYMEESFCSFTIQGHNSKFENDVVKMSRFIQRLLRKERQKGNVHSISNRQIGFDETTKIYTKIISYWVRY